MNPLYNKLKTADRSTFDIAADLKLIDAFKNRVPFVGSPRIEMPLYRCYFLESGILITALHHITPSEQGMLVKILKNPGFKSGIQYFSIINDRVCGDGAINTATLAHVLYRCHHRIAKNYLLEDCVAGIFE